MRRHAVLAGLCVAVLLVHGFHPLAEDGGLYVAGVKAALDPTLFPHDRLFVTTTSRYSLFGPLMALCVRALHAPLLGLLPIVYVGATWLMLLAAWRLTRAVGVREDCQIGGVALLAAWMTLPVAGTSLLLMDPYVTGRTMSTPLGLLALSYAAAYERGRNGLLWKCLACLLAATAFHALMAAYAAALVAAVLVAKMETRRRLQWFLGLGVAAMATAVVLQLTGRVDTAAMAAAAQSRYYWFLSQWQWFELLGLAGPLVILGVLSRIRTGMRSVSVGSIAVSAIALLVATTFARESAAVHTVAQLQPLRVFLLVYGLMAVLMGCALAEWIGSKPVLWFAMAMALVMCFVQRQIFPGSPHLEWMGKGSTNAWSEAFVWSRDHTPKDARFAIDAHYISAPGEDSQVFRAIAERDVLPDFSKDGGASASNTALAEAWWRGFQLQQGLDSMSDAARLQRLQPAGVSWVVLKANSVTGWTCPYKNATVKVCTLTVAKR